MVKGYSKLIKIREKYNLSHKEMADKLQISKCYYWQLENRTRNLYYDTAVRIAKIFDLKPDELFYEKEPKVKK